MMKTLWAFLILSRGFGQFRSMRQRECVDHQGRPLPWYTYPTIEFLEQLDLSDCRIFEYGCGFSTLFWARKAKHVSSVEDNREWYEKMRDRIPGNVDLRLVQDRNAYVQSIRTFPDPFDIIAIDGGFLSDRLLCARMAIESLAPTGLIILDNSDWVPKAASLLRDGDLIEIDMSGFCPINRFTSTTSLFLRRKVRLRPVGGRQPTPSIGSVCLETDERENL